MTNVNEAVEVEVTEEVVKPKRTRKVTPKVEKTAGDIIIELEELAAELQELEAAVNSLDSDSIVFPIVNDAYQAKKTEYEKALTTVYTV